MLAAVLTLGDLHYKPGISVIEQLRQIWSRPAALDGSSDPITIVAACDKVLNVLGDNPMTKVESVCCFLG